MSSPRRVVVTKHTQTLIFYQGSTPLCLPVVLGKNPASRYHRFLGLSYPTVEDAERGLRDQLITPEEAVAIRAAIASRCCPPWKTALGGEVGIHGPCPNVTWTHGCIATSISSIEKLYDQLELGDPVTILP